MKLKVKIWNTNRADKEFSLYIRNRDKICQLCERGKLQVKLDCSHFWSRNRSSTRYNELNCICLCRGCHYRWELEKAGEYMDFMKKRLGQKKYKELYKLAHSSLDRRTAIINLMSWLKK